MNFTAVFLEEYLRSYMENDFDDDFVFDSDEEIIKQIQFKRRNRQPA